jgi:DUF971 family protein
MRPVDLQHIGDELAIKWDDASESFISLKKLRRACPCAECKGERDVMGNLYKGPERPLTALAFQLRGLNLVGSYGVQPSWADGHSSGIYPFEYLHQIAEVSD